MSREHLGEEPEVATRSGATLEADLDLGERAPPGPRRHAPAPPDGATPPDAPTTPDAAARPAARGPSHPLVAIVVGAVFAAAVAVLTAYQQTRRTVSRNAAAASSIAVWPDRDATLSTQVDRVGSPADINLHLSVSGGVALTVERINVGDDLKLTPPRPVRLQPGREVTTSFSFLAECSAPADLVAVTATVRDERDEPLRVRVNAVGYLLETVGSAGCPTASTVTASDLVAHRDGSLTFTLAAQAGTPPSRVAFVLADRSSGSPWRLSARPDNRVTVRAGEPVEVTLRLSYRGCLRDGTLPRTGGLLRTLVRSAYGSQEEYLSGWDDGPVGAAATSAALQACG